MTKQNGYFLRRILEVFGTSLLSSCVLFILILANLIPATRAAYIVVFTISAMVFLVLNYFALFRHFWALTFDIKKYLTVNLSIFAFFVISSLITLRFGSPELFTAFFGYTKPLRQILTISNLSATLIFWAVYLALIFGVIIEILFLDKEYKKLKQKGILNTKEIEK